MMLGPDLIYRCPHCDNFITVESLLSGNTFGATIDSDGKSFAPMMPEFPDLTKCKKCNSILWLSKLEEEGFLGSKNQNPKWKNASKAEFLERQDYFDAINMGIPKNEREELFIRQRIWWAYNDRVRQNKPIFEDHNDQLFWRENIKKLIDLYEWKDLNQRIMIAELKRNLGDFEGCLNVIDSIDSTELDWVKKRLVQECNKENTKVIELVK